MYKHKKIKKNKGNAMHCSFFFFYKTHFGSVLFFFLCSCNNKQAKAMFRRHHFCSFSVDSIHIFFFFREFLNDAYGFQKLIILTMLLLFYYNFIILFSMECYGKFKISLEKNVILKKIKSKLKYLMMV